MGHQLVEVGLPLAEVVVHVKRRDAGPLAPLLQRGDVFGRFDRVRQQQFPAGEFHVVDDIDQQQRDLGMLGDVAVQVRVLCGHGKRIRRGYLKNHAQKVIPETMPPQRAGDDTAVVWIARSGASVSGSLRFHLPLIATTPARSCQSR